MSAMQRVAFWLNAFCLGMEHSALAGPACRAGHHPQAHAVRCTLDPGRFSIRSGRFRKRSSGVARQTRQTRHDQSFVQSLSCRRVEIFDLSMYVLHGQLAYPLARWLMSPVPFSQFGLYTDGPGTPWAEWCGSRLHDSLFRFHLATSMWQHHSVQVRCRETTQSPSATICGKLVSLLPFTHTLGSCSKWPIALLLRCGIINHAEFLWVDMTFLGSGVNTNQSIPLDYWRGSVFPRP
jgi:hypothetical protein